MGWRVGWMRPRAREGSRWVALARLATTVLFVFAGALVWAGAASGAEGKPINTEAPKIEGKAEVGQLLKATAGKWEGTEPIEYKYKWEECAETCKLIPGAPEESTYRVTSAVLGKPLRVKVEAKNSIAHPEKASAKTADVTAEPPVNIEAPTITGPPEEEGAEALKATTGKWEGAEPITYTYQWESCNVFPEETSCIAIPGATEASYKPSAEAVGHKLRVTVTATNSGGSEKATSAETTEVLPHAGTAAVAWGDNYPDGELGAGYKDNYETVPVPVRDLSDIRTMIPAGETSYALLDSGVVRAWGDSGSGDLGNDVEHPGKPPASPVAVDEKTKSGEIREMTGVTALAANFGAFTHAMALVSEGGGRDQVMTWGGAAIGERGNGEYDPEKQTEHKIEPRDVAIPVPSLEHKHIIAITTGGNTDFALQEEAGKQTLWAWGSNWFGKLGIGKEGRIKNEEAEEGQDVCYGDGVGKTACVPTPQPVHLPALPAGVKVTAISAGQHAMYVLLSNGRVLAWGENSVGQLGDGTLTNSDLPVYVCASGHGGCSPEGESPEEDYLTKVKAIAGGELFALALLENDEVVGWGVNVYGNLSGEGNEECTAGSLNCRTTPKIVEKEKKQTAAEPVKPLEDVTAIAAGSNMSLAVVNGSNVYSWGSNEHGQLGVGKWEGPEIDSEKEPGCGIRKLYVGGKHFEFARSCSRYPLELKLYVGEAGFLSHVDGIAASAGADPNRAAYAHSFVWLREGKGPAPVMSVTPETEDGKAVFKLRWRINSPTSEYQWRWKQEPPANDPNVIVAEEYEIKVAEEKLVVYELTVKAEEKLEEQEKVEKEEATAKKAREKEEKEEKKKEAAAETKEAAAANKHKDWEKAKTTAAKEKYKKEEEADLETAKEDRREAAEYKKRAEEDGKREVELKEAAEKYKKEEEEILKEAKPHEEALEADENVVAEKEAAAEKEYKYTGVHVVATSCKSGGEEACVTNAEAQAKCESKEPGVEEGCYTITEAVKKGAENKDEEEPLNSAYLYHIQLLKDHVGEEPGKELGVAEVSP
jgi:alpha-tubulin suppressor-like RCC1 family protein